MRWSRRRAAGLAPREAEVWARIGDVMLDIYHQSRKSEYLTEALKAWKISLDLNGRQDELRRRVEIYDKQGH